jgi:hypothetical protein
VFDGADTGFECGHDAGFAVAVSSHDSFGLAGLLDDGTQLGAAELLVYRIVDLAHDAA